VVRIKKVSVTVKIRIIAIFISVKSKHFILGEKIDEVGVIEADKEHVRAEPYSLPVGFEWDTIDLGEAKQVCYVLFS